MVGKHYYGSINLQHSYCNIDISELEKSCVGSTVPALRAIAFNVLCYDVCVCGCALRLLKL
jgi:hypothetical protein